MAPIDVTPSQDGGVLKEILTEGEGSEHPPKGCTVKAHYHGTLQDGTVFDSSVERNVPFSFELGKGSVIKAWDIGVATMKKGEKSKFTCRSDYAYGDAGSPPKIPGGATLIFEITLLSWQEEDLTPEKDGGVTRIIIETGEGYSNPEEFSLCKVHLKGMHDDRVFEDREVSFAIGEGSENGIPQGVEIALLKMIKGEKSKITIKPRYHWPSGNQLLGIPAGATIGYEITLIQFEKKESWDMDAADKIAECKMLKDRATDYFKAGKYELAVKLYKKSLSYVESDQGFSDSETEEQKKLTLAIQLNLGLVYLKMNEPTTAKNELDKALELEPNNVKGLFRRGQANLARLEPEIALKDFEKVIGLEPSNSAAVAQITACKKKIVEIKQREKQIYSNMFEKFARKDQEEDIYRFGWWDDKQKQPLIKEKEPEIEDENVEERKKERRKQLENMKKIVEQRKREKEEQEKREREEKEKKEKEKKEEAGNVESVKVEEGNVNQESVETHGEATKGGQHSEAATGHDVDAGGVGQGRPGAPTNDV